jgi:hypothetical protein
MTATEENHFTSVEGSSESVYGCENFSLPCVVVLLGPPLKCRHFQEKFRRRPEQFDVFWDQSGFGKQLETYPHLTPVMTSWCKYQDAFCVLVACQVMGDL